MMLNSSRVLSRRLLLASRSSSRASSSSSSSLSSFAKVAASSSSSSGNYQSVAAWAATGAVLVAGWTVSQDNHNRKTETFFRSKSTEQAVREVETKFATYWPRCILILFGPPGAGKGTHGPKIETMLQLPQLSTGDMLRAAVANKTDIGQKAEAVMKAGGLVSDDIVVGIIRDRIQEADCKFGFILDGFPRTLPQAQALDDMLAQEGARVSKVIELQVPDQVLKERITGRWIHKASGRSYHVKYAPPKSMKKDNNGQPIADSMKDDATGEPLSQRPDDTAEALKKRLQGYHKDTVPILDHYRPEGIVKEVNADQGMDGVWKEILEALKRGDKK